MRYDFLREPISDEAPCGPDLEESFDPDYNNYVLEASGLVPDRFYDRSQNRIFDRSTININQHQETIAGLLGRTRDLRLLVLDARLQLLATRLAGFSEALQGMAILAAEFWDTFHPLPLDGDMIIRQNTLEGLDDLRVLIPSLQFCTIVEGRSRLTYRNYLVATGAIEPWEVEEVISRDMVERLLHDDNNKPQLQASYEAVVASLEALASIRTTFIDRAGHVNAPAFERLEDVLGGMRTMLEGYLGIGDGAAAAAADDSGTATAGGTAAATVTLTGAVTDHASAKAALKAAEDYFQRIEPSSPVLILVHQARLLIGRPLIEALDTLLPEPAARASVRFESGFRFNLDLSRMRTVTENLLAESSGQSDDSSWSSGEDSTEQSWSSDDYATSDASAEESADDYSGSDESAATGEETSAEDAAYSAPTEAPPAAPSPAPTAGPATFVANTRLEASNLLSEVETFFRVVEPSSPVPTLLVRARSYMGKDFVSILNEMIPPEPDYGT